MAYVKVSFAKNFQCNDKKCLHKCVQKKPLTQGQMKAHEIQQSNLGYLWKEASPYRKKANE